MMQERPTVVVLGAFIIGLVLGLVYAWSIDPLEWQLLSSDAAANAICASVGNNQDDIAPDEQERMERMVQAYNGVGCQSADEAAAEQPAAEGEGEESGGSNTLLLWLALVVLGVAVFIVMRRRSALMEDTVEEPKYEIPEAGPVLAGDESVETVPIARFTTTYQLGHDIYDDSFSIENSAADFLGECGVSIAESLTATGEKNVTAFEVWLFDKNDIRTITKVLMSDHAFFDDALKAKLAPKGEPVLAREGETVVLETATLIINAEVTELTYGTGTQPPQSYFDRITIELSAWSKEGDFDEPDLEGRADQLMNF